MKVSNPLTIIAIFSGLAETLATVALIKLPPGIQEIFVYFVMAFPTGLVLLFFIVLYFKNTVLYAPSDFEDQAHYLELNKVKKNINEQLDQIFSQINSKGISLSKVEIDQAKARVERSVEEAIPISLREREIVKLCATGAPISQIAEKLNLSSRTVNYHMHRLIAKGLIGKDEVVDKPNV